MTASPRNPYNRSPRYNLPAAVAALAYIAALLIAIVVGFVAFCYAVTALEGHATLVGVVAVITVIGVVFWRLFR